MAGLHGLPTPAVVNALGFDELEDWGPLAEATGAPMQTRGRTVWEDGSLSAGIWECTAGPSYWVQAENEVIQVLAGRMTVTIDGGEPVHVGAGDLAIFHKGWSGTWEIHETIRKVYAIF
jgi:uncharacterized cupin superfamily protein